LRQPVGGGPDKTGLNNQPLGGKGAILTGSVRETARPEQGRKALIGAWQCQSIVDDGGVLVVSTANRIENSGSGWRERRRRRQEVE